METQSGQPPAHKTEDGIGFAIVAGHLILLHFSKDPSLYSCQNGCPRTPASFFERRRRKICRSPHSNSDCFV